MPDPAPASDDEPRWPIDELARRAGATVDAVRFYERRRLLPEPHRQGRTKRYSRPHLARLLQIRHLQEKGFSVSGIAVLLQAEPAAVGTLLGGGDAAGLDRPELARRAGVAEAWLAELEAVGLLGPPGDVGREGYDGADLRAVAAARELIDLGHAPATVLRLLAIYVDALEPMERRAYEVMSAPGGDLADDLPTVAARSYQLTEQILGYLHRRIGQRLTLERLERDAGAVDSP